MVELFNQGLYVQGGTIIFAEVVVLIIATFLLQFFCGFIIQRFEKAPFLKKKAHVLEKIRKGVWGVLVKLCFVLCLFVVAFNGYLMSQQVEPLARHKELVQAIPPNFWTGLLLALGQIILLVIAAPMLIRKIQQMLAVLTIKTKALGKIKTNDESIEAFFCALGHILTNAVWLFVFVAITNIIPFPAFIPTYLFIGLRIYIIIALGLLIVKAVHVAIETLNALSQKYAKSGTLLDLYNRLKGLIPLLIRSLEYIIYVSVATLVLLQTEFISSLADYGPRIIQIIGIVFLSRAVVEVANLVIDKSMPVPEKISDTERQQRLTIIPLIRSSLKYLIYFGAAILMLRAWGINPAPVLAGAGILGVVVGLGAQPLINDIVSGFFIIFENMYLVDDFIETSTASGTVEAIEIRTTHIRSPNGQLHILRNGQIGDVINYSKEYIHTVVEVGVAYDSDLDHVYRVLEQTGEELKKLRKDVLAVTRVDGLKDFGESELTIRTVTKVKPGRHLAVGFALRKMIKEAFDRENIEIPFARRVLIFKDGQDAKLPQRRIAEKS